jgi:hypothetical protein
MKKIILTVVVLISVLGAKAQEFSVGADVVSSYVWRGAYQGGGASIQPTLGFGVGDFSLSAWGSTNFNGGNKEFDITAGYQFGPLGVAVTDYWWEGEDAFKYLNYGETTNHLFEGTLSFTLPTESFPLALGWNTFFAGNDKDAEGDNRLSTYVTADYPFKVKDVDVQVGLGLTPWESLYAEKFAVVNVNLKATKSVKFSDSFSLPVFGQIILNPRAEDVFLVFGVTF